MITLRRRRAVTFIEMMFVIVIMGVLLAIALPNMTGTRDSAALKSASRELLSAGMLARQQAITQGEETALVIIPADNQWRLSFFDEVKEQERAWQDRRTPSKEEAPRPLQTRISFAKLENELGEVKPIEGEVRLVFYPNGTCSGLAIQLRNRGGHELVVDFDRGTGRPESYSGAPKTVAQKLKEQGLDPAEFGLVDESVAVAQSKPGEGFTKTAGWTEDQRVDHYKDAVERMLERSRTRHAISEAGSAGAYYNDATRWGN